MRYSRGAFLGLLELDVGRDVNSTTGVCGFCAESATVADWTPDQAWLTVDACRCGGFFIQKPLWDRLSRLPDEERRNLATRIRRWRAEGYEAWVIVAAEHAAGPIVIASRRPAPATERWGASRPRVWQRRPP